MMLRKEYKWFIPMPYYRSDDRNDELHCPSCGTPFRGAFAYGTHYMAEHKMEKKEADARAKARREKRKLAYLNKNRFTKEVQV